MSDKPSASRLAGKSVLIVEDEFLIAFDIADQFETAGAQVLGPFASVSAALEALDDGGLPDAAVLDVNLGDERSVRVAQRLTQDDVPFVFVTGYDSSSLAEERKMGPILQKPFAFDAAIAALFPS
mgnify:CR=1 FL=1